MRTKLISLFLLFALLLIPTGNAYAQSPSGDIIRIGENYTLKEGETLTGSLIVIGGNATLEKDSKITGDVVVIGGELTVDGAAKGNIVIIGGNGSVSSKVGADVVAIGGQITLTETAVVGGNVVTMGGQVEQEPGAEVAGDIINNVEPMVEIPDVPNVPNVPNTPNTPNVPNTPDGPNVNIDFNPFWEIVTVLWRAVAVAAVGMLLTLFLQPQLERVADAVTKQPVMAGSFGLLAVVVTPLAIIIMTVTLILIPVALLVALIIPLAWLFGMVALGQEVGERFTKAINQTWAPVLSTGLGTLILVLVTGFLGLIPCIGWLLSFLVSLFAIGGVAMTWFGTRSAPGATPTVTAPVEIPPAS